MGIWDRSIMRGRRILPNVAEPLTSFGLGVDVLRHGTKSETSGYYEAIEMSKAGELFLYAPSQVSKVSAENVRVFANNFGSVYGPISYNETGDVFCISGEYSSFVNASTWSTLKTFQSVSLGAVCADQSTGDFLIGGSGVRRYSGAGTLINTGNRGAELARGVAMDASGGTLFAMFDDVCRIDPVTLAVDDYVVVSEPVQPKMIATNGKIVAFVTTDKALHCYTIKFEHLWSKGITDYVDVNDIAMDVFGDIYLAGKGSGNSGLLRRFSEKNGDLVLDIENDASWKLPIRTNGITGVSVNSSGLVAACSDEYYRVIEQS